MQDVSCWGGGSEGDRELPAHARFFLKNNLKSNEHTWMQPCVRTNGVATRHHFSLLCSNFGWGMGSCVGCASQLT